eukprot:993275-Pyramimonas_sp.AAC.1
MRRHRKEPQEKLQKPNQHMMTDGSLRFTRNQKLILSRMSRRCGTQHCKKKENCWSGDTCQSGGALATPMPRRLRPPLHHGRRRQLRTRLRRTWSMR